MTAVNVAIGRIKDRNVGSKSTVRYRNIGADAPRLMIISTKRSDCVNQTTQVRDIAMKTVHQNS